MEKVFSLSRRERHKRNIAEINTFLISRQTMEFVFAAKKIFISNTVYAGMKPVYRSMKQTPRTLFTAHTVILVTAIRT
jgi:hypothetical protein